MKPKIGFSTRNIFYEGKDKLNYDIMEITSKDVDFKYNIMKILKIKEELKGKDLSFHTGTSRIFSCIGKGYPEFNEAELDIVRAEIITCKIIGCKEYIFHMKQDKLTKSEEKKWREVIDFSKKKEIEMIYESNIFFSAEVCLDFLKRFPDVNYNLDLGHFNTAIGSGKLGMGLEDFISKVKDRVVYIHAHNNSGLEDEHKALNDGTLNWKHVFDMLDMSKVRKIIVESKKADDIEKSIESLERYFR